MGTHPIFESDFDCLTDKKMEKENIAPKEKKITGSSKTPFPVPRLPIPQNEKRFPLSPKKGVKVNSSYTPSYMKSTASSAKKNNKTESRGLSRPTGSEIPRPTGKNTGRTALNTKSRPVSAQSESGFVPRQTGSVKNLPPRPNTTGNRPVSARKPISKPTQVEKPTSKPPQKSNPQSNSQPNRWARLA